MKYIILILSIFASLAIGYEVGLSVKDKREKAQDISSTFIDNELRVHASRSLKRDIIYYELSEIIETTKALELIKQASLENMRNEIDFLSRFSSNLKPNIQQITNENIAEILEILNITHNKTRQIDC